MEYKALRLFVEIVRHGGFTEAAQACGVSQSAVSKAVKGLESECGFTLLERDAHHRRRLSQAGELVYRRALRMMLERQSLEEELDDLRGLRRGTLRLGLPRVGAGPLFAHSLATFRQRYPGIDVELTEHGSQRLLEGVASGEVEIAATIAQHTEGVTSMLVDSQPLVVLIRRDHPLARHASLHLRDLAHESFLLLSQDFALNQIVADALSRAQIIPRTTTRSTQADFLIDLVEAGMGVTLLPELVLDNHPLADVVAVPLDEHLEWGIHLVWREGAHLSPAAKAWIAIVRERAADESSPCAGTIRPERAADHGGRAVGTELSASPGEIRP
ncbi:DNA-binding transcriptional regulator, LysR family [Propionibacterium cyclohexanicum]|uniref:DNA-binding transcriptional regulator, LysR family n=1 Tax=Propionibacterium cyclohexanicum TaxID=64702 RepID=A0A1H9S9Y0_9ACTN|nr:LysR family transcriptional regulator [Propionibacterium cyclohexanicum]SER81751.1 DNA-binding transcriptional regulator, LysR family [Propionibacterium cyclohexanicum]